MYTRKVKERKNSKKVTKKVKRKIVKTKRKTKDKKEIKKRTSLENLDSINCRGADTPETLVANQDTCIGGGYDTLDTLAMKKTGNVKKKKTTVEWLKPRRQPTEYI